MAWVRKENDDIYDPSYTDMLRVAFTSEFKRGKLQDLVALLSGRNFETKQFEESIAETSFAGLKQGVLNFINETHFKRFVMIIRSAGFVDPSLIGSQNALNFAYILYLTLRGQGKMAADIESAVRRWFVMSALTGRYSGSPESTFDFDIRQMHEQGFDTFGPATFAGELSDAYWDALLPNRYFIPAIILVIGRARAIITTATAIGKMTICKKRIGISPNWSALNSPAMRPAIRFPKEVAKNQAPIICPTKRRGANFVTELRPTGLTHSSPKV